MDIRNDSTATRFNNDSTSHTQLGGQRHDRFRNVGVALGEPDPDEGDVPVSFYQKMLSATSGSLITSLLVNPLDVVRVRLQSQPAQGISNLPRTGPPSAHSVSSFSNLPPNLGISTCCREVFWVSNNTQYCVATPSVTSTTVPTAISNSAVRSAAACAAEEAQSKTFTSTFDGLRKIAQNEGPRTLWRGLSPTLLMAIPANVIYFAGYDWLRYNRQSPFRRFNVTEWYIPLLAGSSARILAAIAVSPIEMFRTRMQGARNTPGQRSPFVETMRGLREMVAASGYRSLWSGLVLTLWRDVPFSALYWWGYEYGREALRDYRDYGAREVVTATNSAEPQKRRRGSLSQEDHKTTLIDSFIAGAASGAFAAFVTTPFDVGKTRQQIIRHGGNAIKNATSTPIPEDLAMPRFLWHIFKTQGTAGLFTGWSARCLKVAPACAIMISSYEIGKKMAGGINERRGTRTPA
ncbi:mitochondrial carrier [Microthyrium microscopicum]|uniref:Mitochondrial carrier n=1 Tax=Microthyrium microscopicum TaxID=703497 RepID=A0A6A6U615_9PEZI|nr:mitochondrial carrier [Microthyrium microscopicum]